MTSHPSVQFRLKITYSRLCPYPSIQTTWLDHGRSCLVEAPTTFQTRFRPPTFDQIEVHDRPTTRTLEDATLRAQQEQKCGIRSCCRWYSALFCTQLHGYGWQKLYVLHSTLKEKHNYEKYEQIKKLFYPWLVVELLFFELFPKS